MKWLAKLLLIIAANAAAIWAAKEYIPGIGFEGTSQELAIAAIVLMLLNSILKPILKLILGPIIVLTLGLGIILVNALVIYVLDLLSQNLTIEGIPALVYATVLISAVNFVVHLATKK